MLCNNPQCCSQLQAGCLAQAMTQGYGLEELLQGMMERLAWKNPAVRATDHKKQRQLCLVCHFPPHDPWWSLSWVFCGFSSSVNSPS